MALGAAACGLTGLGDDKLNAPPRGLEVLGDGEGLANWKDGPEENPVPNDAGVEVPKGSVGVDAGIPLGWGGAAAGFGREEPEPGAVDCVEELRKTK